MFVNKDVGKSREEECRRRIIERIHEVVAEAKSAGMSRKEVLTVVGASLAIDGSPYGETPEPVVGVVGRRRGK